MLTGRSQSKSPEIFSFGGNGSGIRRRQHETPKKSREEIRFILLLDRVQERLSALSSSDVIVQKEDVKKVAFFGRQLQEMLDSLTKHPQAPSKDVLNEYKAKVAFLNGVVDELNAQNLDEEFAKIGVDLQFVGLKAEDRVNLPGDFKRPSADSTFPFPPKSTDVADRTPLSVSAAKQDPKVAEIRQKRQQKRLQDDRRRLFDDEDDYDSGKGADNLKAHREAQENVAEEMLSLTRTLKEQTLAANEMIKKDTETLEKTSHLADKNTERLGVEAERLAIHAGTGCRCWIWFMLLVVCVTFVAMVLVMKIFRKRNWDNYEQPQVANESIV